MAHSATVFTATVSTKGQVVIPSEVRTSMGVREGDRLAFVVHDGVVSLERVLSRAEFGAQWLDAALATYDEPLAFELTDEENA